jgi:hypothetical protein
VEDLAEAHADVPSLPEALRQSHHRRLLVPDVRVEVEHAVEVGPQPSQQRRARRAAVCHGGVGPQHHRTTLRQPVQVRCPSPLRAVGAKIGPQIVQDEQEDVWAAARVASVAEAGPPDRHISVGTRGAAASRAESWLSMQRLCTVYEYVHSCTSWIQHQWGFSKPLSAPKRNRKGGRQRKARTRWQSKKPECNAKRLAYTCSFPSPSCENRLPPFWARPFSAPGDVALSTISVASC